MCARTMNIELPPIQAKRTRRAHAPNRGIHATMCSGMTKECLTPRAVVSLACATGTRTTTGFLFLCGTFHVRTVLAVGGAGQTATDAALFLITPRTGRSSRRDIVPACDTTPREITGQPANLPKRWQAGLLAWYTTVSAELAACGAPTQ